MKPADRQHAFVAALPRFRTSFVGSRGALSIGSGSKSLLSNHLVTKFRHVTKLVAILGRLVTTFHFKASFQIFEPLCQQDLRNKS